MRRNVLLSFIAWTAIGSVPLSLAACAKSVENDQSPFTINANEGGTSTQTAGGSEDGGGSSSQIPTTGDDSGSTSTPTGDDAGGNSSPSEDAGSSSGGEDSGGSSPPPSEDSGPPSEPDSGSTPPAEVNCPDTSKYQDEYVDLVLEGIGNACATNSDCTASQCCYAGTEAQELEGPLCVKN